MNDAVDSLLKTSGDALNRAAEYEDDTGYAAVYLTIAGFIDHVRDRRQTDLTLDPGGLDE